MNIAFYTFLKKHATKSIKFILHSNMKSREKGRFVLLLLISTKKIKTVLAAVFIFLTVAMVWFGHGAIGAQVQ